MDWQEMVKDTPLEIWQTPDGQWSYKFDYPDSAAGHIGEGNPSPDAALHRFLLDLPQIVEEEILARLANRA